jgi:hypothetical protein
MSAATEKITMDSSVFSLRFAREFCGLLSKQQAEIIAAQRLRLAAACFCGLFTTDWKKTNKNNARLLCGLLALAAVCPPLNRGVNPLNPPRRKRRLWGGYRQEREG